MLYWGGEEAERRGQDWAGESQTFRFATQAEAERYAADCATNPKAWEYEAVRLKQPRWSAPDALICRSACAPTKTPVSGGRLAMPIQWWRGRAPVQQGMAEAAAMYVATASLARVEPSPKYSSP